MRRYQPVALETKEARASFVVRLYGETTRRDANPRPTEKSEQVHKVTPDKGLSQQFRGWLEFLLPVPGDFVLVGLPGFRAACSNWKQPRLATPFRLGGAVEVPVEQIEWAGQHLDTAGEVIGQVIDPAILPEPATA